MPAAAEPPSPVAIRPMVSFGSRVLLRAMRRGAICCMVAGLLWIAAAAAAQGQTPPANTQQTQATPQLPRVTTTVEVHADTKNSYLPETVTAGTLEGAPLK